MGYSQAGFDVIGIDINPQLHYPFQSVQANAIEVLDELLINGRYVLPPEQRFRQMHCIRLMDIAVIHASPPCQRYSTSTAQFRKAGREYPDLVGPTRDRIKETRLPYVIENVPHAPLIDPVTLCGSQFGLTTVWPGNGLVALRRHRLFESSEYIPDAGPHDHSLLTVPVYGHGIGLATQKRYKRTKGCAQAQREVMRIDWMTTRELCEAIPPAYTNYVGRYVMARIVAAEIGLAA